MNSMKNESLNLDLSLITEKSEAVSTIRGVLNNSGYNVVEEDTGRPWGGYFRIHENQAGDFLKMFFSDTKMPEWIEASKKDPKILLVSPKTKLSWQYHDRRSEAWRVIGGQVGAIMSETDDQGKVQHYRKGDIIIIPQGMRHRLVGLDHFGVVVEIWVSTDPSNPTDEQDNHRLQDDFGRA